MQKILIPAALVLSVYASALKAQSPAVKNLFDQLDRARFEEFSSKSRNAGARAYYIFPMSPNIQTDYPNCDVVTLRTTAAERGDIGEAGCMITMTPPALQGFGSMLAKTQAPDPFSNEIVYQIWRDTVFNPVANGKPLEWVRCDGSDQCGIRVLEFSN